MPTATFYPDADGAVGATSMDGIARRNGVSETWDEIHDTADAVLSIASTNGLTIGLVADVTTGRWQSLHRAFLLFDTSSIPDSATITSASLYLLRSGAVSDDFTQSLYVTSSNPASNTSLVEADYSATGTTKYNAGLSLGSFTSVLIHTEVPLNATGVAAISKNGITKFALRLSGDIDDIEPVWVSGANSSLGVRSSDFDAQSGWPYLSVTYTTNDAPVVNSLIGDTGLRPHLDGMVGLRARLKGEAGLTSRVDGLGGNRG